MKPPLTLIHLLVLIGFALLSAYAAPAMHGAERSEQTPCTSCFSSHTADRHD